MELSIYMSETIIHVVTGQIRKEKIEIQSVCHFALGEGTLINDVITNEADLKEMLLEIGARYPKFRNKIHLVVGGRAITKVVSVPVMNKRQLLNLTRRELKSYCLEPEDMVYDYSVIRSESGRQGGTILCAGLERNIIENYKRLFADCKMKVKTMGIALGCVINLVENLNALRGKTFILSVLDGRNVMSVLYVNGFYTYTSRIRLLPECPLLEQMKEISDSINAILKFYRMQDLDSSIENLYICGLNDKDEREYFPLLSKRTGMNTESLPDEEILYHGRVDGFKPGDYLYAVGNLLGR